MVVRGVCVGVSGVDVVPGVDGVGVSGADVVRGVDGVGLSGVECGC